MKKCNKCKVEKGLVYFYRDNARKDGYSYICIQCEKKRSKKYRARNKKKIKERDKVYNLENKERVAAVSGRWQESNKDHLKKYMKKHYEKNKKKIDLKNIKWRIDNKEKYEEWSKKYGKEYRRKNKDRIKKYNQRPQIKLKKRMSLLIRNCLKKRDTNKKGLKTWTDILPYSIDEFMDHMQSQFEPGMTWDNYGFGENKWSIDHIVPDSWFDYDDVFSDGFHKSWELKNLKPMWSYDNCGKGNRYVG